MEISYEYSDEEKKVHAVHELEITYHFTSENEFEVSYPYMLRAEAERCRLSLVESKRLLFARVHDDFHK